MMYRHPQPLRIAILDTNVEHGLHADAALAAQRPALTCGRSSAAVVGHAAGFNIEWPFALPIVNLLDVFYRTV